MAISRILQTAWQQSLAPNLEIEDPSHWLLSCCVPELLLFPSISNNALIAKQYFMIGNVRVLSWVNGIRDHTSWKEFRFGYIFHLIMSRSIETLLHAFTDKSRALPTLVTKGGRPAWPLKIGGIPQKRWRDPYQIKNPFKLILSRLLYIHC